jgi:hypothetical protein
MLRKQNTIVICCTRLRELLEAEEFSAKCLNFALCKIANSKDLLFGWLSSCDAG